MDVPDELHEEIRSAFREDDAQAVRRILAAHPDLRGLVNQPIGPFGSRAVTGVRSRDMLDVLIDAGADLNAKSDWWAGGFGLLHMAPPEVCSYAIERGAVVDLHAAARLGMMERVRELVAENPDSVHERGGDGQFPLHFASTIEIAAFLLDHGAEIDARDLDHESTAAQWMTENRHEIVRHLITRECQTDILMASAVGDLDLAGRILDREPDAIRTRVTAEYFPMIGGKTGGTIYQWTLGWYVSAHQVARKFGHYHVLELLLERSPDDVKLVDACWMGDEATVRALLSEGVPDLSPSDRRHLAHAARNNELHAVRLFLECGLPIDTTSQHGATPLHWAAFHGNSEMVRLLLDRGAALELKDADFDGTPLTWAIHGSEHGWYSKEGDYAGSVEVLLEAGAKRPDEIRGTPAVQAVLRSYV